MDQLNKGPRRLLNFNQLLEIGIKFSRAHILRLESGRKFPRRIYLSQQKVAWFDDEILAWLDDRDTERKTRDYNDE